ARMMRAHLPAVLGVIVVARVLRYGGEAYLGIKLGEESMTWLKGQGWTLTFVAFAFCGGVYLAARLNRPRRLQVRSSILPPAFLLQYTEEPWIVQGNLGKPSPHECAPPPCLCPRTLLRRGEVILIYPGAHVTGRRA